MVKLKTTERSAQCLKRELDNVKQKYGELEAKAKQLKEVLNLILNENFSGQSTISPYAKRKADEALRGKQDD